ncbi:spermine synthase [Nitratifractor salsuginis]|uniref:Spermine synthase n=1 Tax=Nitratifractor salsuginis (strain DSM 16511 / JCM 12458 / E9I37-1) TaxID=749222 RepID=E6WXY3_NITSE|nr:spermine synthase [Nitratifractor salsuginis]ADV45304.1 Spermine synthase [Nitratifractor salsuginis DSM 16511]
MKEFHFIRDEMLVHVPVCTHADPRRILVVGGCDNIRTELGKYSIFEEIIHIDAHGAAEALRGLGAKKFDVAIVADDRFGADREFWIELTKLLDEKGLASAMMSDIITQPERSKEELKTLGAIYRIVMPYRYEGELQSDGILPNRYLVLASRFYHPTADINLQRADLTDGFRYYNSDIAVAAFQTPTFVNREYLGIIKR